MPNVISRKTIFVKAVLDATGEFTYRLDVPFHVDDLIYNCWACGVTTAARREEIMTLTLVGLGEIGFVSEQESECPKHIVNVDRAINGTTKFTIRSSAGTIIDQTGCELVFALEFLEYER